MTAGEMLIDLHAHTKGISRCCRIYAPEVLEAAKAAGLDGICLCNHYQTLGRTMEPDGDDPAAFARRYIEEFHATRELGEAMGLTVLFGIEVTTEWIPEGKDCTLVLRPESAVLADEGILPCKVIVSCFMGSYQNYHVMVGDTLVKITDFNPRNKRIYKEGETAYVAFDKENVHVL